MAASRPPRTTTSRLRRARQLAAPWELEHADTRTEAAGIGGDRVGPGVGGSVGKGVGSGVGVCVGGTPDWAAKLGTERFLTGAHELGAYVPAAICAAAGSATGGTAATGMLLRANLPRVIACILVAASASDRSLASGLLPPA